MFVVVFDRRAPWPSRRGAVLARLLGRTVVEASCFRGMIVDPGEAAAPLSCGVDLRGRQGAELLGHLNLDPSISSRCLLAVVVDPWCRRRHGEGVES